MLVYIQNLLDPAQLEAIAERLAAPGIFTPGESTTTGRARRVKHNLQARGDALGVKGVLKLVESTLLGHEVFRAAARPRQLVRLMISRYEEGMGYGPHVDAPLMDGVRTDLSFTLFLSSPEDYGGGELLIDMGHGQEMVKLSAGSLVLYPTRYLHRVAPVTAGARLAAVGWVRSHIRDETQRDLLFNLDTVIAELAVGQGERISDRLANLRANLVRLWVED